MFGLPAIVCYTFSARPVRFALGLGALLLVAQLDSGAHGRSLREERTFFGVVRVTIDPSGRFHQLVHGHTIHGRQRRAGSLRNVPLSYYHPTGPAGDVFQHVRGRRDPAAVGVVGLGAGSLCAYARPGDAWTFYELDAAVERVARDARYFTFWRDCRADPRAVVIGDARLRLAEADDGRYGVLVVDAFSSSAIPVHLITREAVALYRRKLAPGGWVLFHLSSQHLDLVPVVATLAHDAGWVAYARDDLVLTPAERETGKEPSRWAVMASTVEALQPLAADRRWRALAVVDGARVWTDDFSNVWSVIRPE
jgi:spermidine synthase